MLNLYGAFKAPDVNHVMIYRDDENPHKFYMVPERPSVARDDEKDPLFTFILYARDVERLAPEEREVERAYLSLSTQVSVSPEDEEKIRKYLRQMLSGELNRRYRFLKNPIVKIEPELGYPPVFTKGSVEFKTFSDELVPYSAGSQEPSLVGTNIASFSQMLNQDGAELFRQSIEKGLIPAIINYKLSFLARIPAISIRIHGNRRDFYEELKKHTIVTETHKRNGKVVSKKTWPEIGSLKEFRNTFHSLTIEIDNGDFREADPSDDVTQNLEELAFRILENNVLPSFFETAFAPATEEQSNNKWLTELEKVQEGSLDIQIKRSDVIEQNVNPNAQLAQVLTPQEVASHTLYVDLGDPYFSELDVRINANVNFINDPVYAVKVFLDYDQQDEKRNIRVKKAKEILFKTADQVYRFRQIMAKGADGATKDAYNYWSEIIYKDTGETIRVPKEGAIESRERELVISYRRLGFVKVNLILGSMPDNVKTALVKIFYPGSNQPGAEQNFELTREKPTASYFTYTGETGDTKPYRYQITYVLADGQRMTEDEQSGKSENLTISSPFEQTITTRFLGQADFTAVDKIIVDAHYADQANDFSADHHAEMVNNGDTSAWPLNLPDPNKRNMEYKVTIIYKNGSREEKAVDKKRLLGETIPVGTGAIDALEVTVIPSMLDWTKYKLALVYLEYTDPANIIKETKNFTFKPETGNDDVVWKVLLRDKEQRSYRYNLRFFGVNSADNWESGWRDYADPILVLESQ